MPTKGEKCECCTILRKKYLMDLRAYQGTDLWNKYKASIITVTYKGKEYKGMQGSCTFDMNFCPECGVSIKKRLRQWREEMRDQSRI